MTDRQKTTKDETPIWLHVPARYSNLFVISITGGIVRISFGEALGGQNASAFHSAIAVTPQDALLLAQFISDNVKNIPSEKSESSRNGE